ncbi:hypothetical protein EJB05_27677 [Eragrostis curvula]|uniref:Uncharacterized protein n=1 Tax=Eragrostis curvula TaxID=38414 RepID=A0A5J9UMY2_9POAL|nr:hypothetical protein EJB05_27677 [Eragrostis curvula]
MEAMAKIFVFLLLCCFCAAGNASYQPCKLSDLDVTQAVMPGPVVGGYREYAVALTNGCVCSQINLKLACPGFNPSVRVYPAGVLSMDREGKLCTLTLNGSAIGIGPENAVMFSYSSRSQISFKPVSSTIVCSDASAPAPAPESS